MQDFTSYRTVVKPIVKILPFPGSDLNALRDAGVIVKQGNMPTAFVLTKKCTRAACNNPVIERLDLTPTRENELHRIDATIKLTRAECLCETCETKARLSRIQHAPASSGGNGGNSTRRSHRPRRSNTGYTRTQIKAMQRDIIKMTDWLHQVETGMLDAPADMVERVKATLAAYISVVETYRGAQ